MFNILLIDLKLSKEYFPTILDRIHGIPLLVLNTIESITFTSAYVCSMPLPVVENIY